MAKVKGFHKFLLDLGNLSVGQTHWINISNDSFDGMNAGGETALKVPTASSAMGDYYYAPYASLGVGLLGGAFLAHKNKSSIMGYATYMGVLGILGAGLGYGFSKLLGKSKSSSAASTSTSTGLDAQMEQVANDGLAKLSTLGSTKMPSADAIKGGLKQLATMTVQEKSMFIDYMKGMVDAITSAKGDAQAASNTTNAQATSAINALNTVSANLDLKYGKDATAAFMKKLNGTDIGKLSLAGGATTNDVGAILPVLTDNRAGDMATAIYESKAPSFANIFSSDTVTPLDILQYQLYSKANWAKLQSKFNEINSTDLYGYLTTFLDKGDVDAAIAKLA